MSYQGLNRFEEAKQTLRQASERGLDIPDSLVSRFQLAFINGNQAGMQSVSTPALKESSVKDAVVDQESFAEAYVGHMQEAKKEVATCREPSPADVGAGQSGPI